MTTSTKIILSIVLAITLIAFLYWQPKYVVDNEKLEKADQIMQQSGEAVNPVHGSGLQEDVEPIIYSLKRKFFVENSDNSLNFADSLASMYFKLGYLDSALTVAKHLESNRNTTSLKLQGDIYYKAFSFAINKEDATKYASLAKERFQAVLDEDGENFEIKTKMAMMLVSSENPMQGILMLREITEKNPNNWDANFNLGLLSIQSGQYARAVERFEKLVGLKSNDVQANFYLALSYFELGESEKAKTQFLKVKQLDNDPAVNATVDDYLQQIEKNIN